MKLPELKELVKDDILPPIVSDIGEEAIIDQVQEEHEVCWEFLRPRLEENLLRLTVYNNQKRDKSKIGDPLLFTVFQTLLAALYNDRLSVKFLPNEEGDIDRAENNNEMAEYDYRIMQKDMLDYDWDWDAMFCGWGLVLFNEFDRKKKCPIPEVVDPFTFLRDPRAVAPNGDTKGNNSLRFWGRELDMTGWELKNSKAYFNINNLKKGKDLRSLIAKAKEKRRKAQGLAELSSDKDDDMQENGQYNILHWYTHIEGKKYLVGLGNAKTELVRFTEIKDDRWPLIKRNLFPTAHNWDGVSVPDLVEDKQRARAVIENLGLDGAKADVMPNYLYAEDRIKNKSDLNFGFNKFIRVSGQSADGAVAQMPRTGLTNKVQWIMDLMDLSAQKALATPEISQGVNSQQPRTLGELELVSAKVDTRNSLAVKIWGWSEREFWQQYNYIYKRDFKDGIDEKITRIIGPWGPKFSTLQRDDIVFEADPDIDIESTQLAEAKRIMDRNSYTAFLGVAQGDPTFNLRFAMKKYAELNGMKRDQVKILFPPTLDELDSEKENEMIDEKKRPVVEITQDHNVHIVMHSRLPEGKLRDDHIEAHKYAMYQQRQNSVLFNQPMAGGQPTEQPAGAGMNIKPQINMPIGGKAKPSQASRQTTNIPESYQQ